MKAKIMKTTIKPSIPFACYSFGSVICAGAVLLTVSSVQAQNLFVSDISGNIYNFTPGGARGTFASGLSGPEGLAFQPVPEPSVLGLLAIGATALVVRRRRC
jgi:hypothetical protein